MPPSAGHGRPALMRQATNGDYYVETEENDGTLDFYDENGRHFATMTAKRRLCKHAQSSLGRC